MNHTFPELTPEDAEQLIEDFAKSSLSTGHTNHRERQIAFARYVWSQANSEVQCIIIGGIVDLDDESCTRLLDILKYPIEDERGDD